MNPSIYTAAFWKDVADRAIRTFAQALLSIFANEQLGIHELDWMQGGLIAASAAAAVVVFSVAYPSKEWRDTTENPGGKHVATNNKENTE